MRGRRYLVIVRAAVSRCCLFRSSRTIRHWSSSSTLPHVTTIITDPYASFFCIHLLLQVKVWAVQIIILYKTERQNSLNECRTNFCLFLDSFCTSVYTKEIYIKTSESDLIFNLTSSPKLENCLLMGLIQVSPPPAFSGP